MNNKTVKILEYDKIKEIIKTYAVSDIAKDMIDKLEPYTDIKLIENYMMETTEARKIVDITSSIPIHSLKGIKTIMDKTAKGGVLSPDELETISELLRECQRLKRFMKGKENCAPHISTYALSVLELSFVSDEIERCIAHGRVDDRASSALSKIRKKIAVLESRIKSRLDSIINNSTNKSAIQDNIVSMRDGRYVIPVKSEYKKTIEGSVLDSSSSGSTVFIEPAEIRKLHDELLALQIEEEKEVYKVLSSLTTEVYSHEREISINIETMADYDFIFAKGKYSRAIDGNSVSFNMKNYINIKNGRHPLLKEDAVPLQFEIGKSYRSLVITGPNTGGKTVALKTVGLLTMMAQSGLNVPAAEDSEFAIFADVLADIGDGQSIEESLSTFSAHIKNIIEIIKCADKHTLVIVDEIGAGTDPGEGVGIAISILEELYSMGAVIVATTHYNEIKDFAAEHEGFINGCMEFDVKTLKPLYKLTIGKAGESNAFLIALRLGMDKRIIERAHMVTYKEKKDYSGYEAQNSEEKLSEEIDAHKESVKELVKAEKREENKQIKKPSFSIGDCVYVNSMGRTGIVYEIENSRGEIGVMVMKKKYKVNKKRVSLYINSKEMYPDDYDFDIVFESVENRKKKHIMNKHHVEGMEIEIKKGSESRE